MRSSGTQTTCPSHGTLQQRSNESRKATCTTPGGGCSQFPPAFTSSTKHCTGNQDTGGGRPILLFSSSTSPSHSTRPTYSNYMPTQLTKLNRCQPLSSRALPQTSLLHMLAQSSCFCSIQPQPTAVSSSLQRPLHSSERCPRLPIQYSATLRSRVCTERIHLRPAIFL